jgi:hypothetical protein
MISADVINYMADFCQGPDLLRLSKVNRHYREALQDNVIYKEFHSICCSSRVKTLHKAVDNKAYHVMSYIADKLQPKDNAGIDNPEFLRDIIKYKPNLPPLDEHSFYGKDLIVELLALKEWHLVKKYIGSDAPFYLYEYTRLKGEDVDIIKFLLAISPCTSYYLPKLIKLKRLSTEGFGLIYRSIQQHNPLLVRDILDGNWRPTDIDYIEDLFRSVGRDITIHYRRIVDGELLLHRVKVHKELRSRIR